VFCETGGVNSQDLLDHGRRIAELERKVSELYKRLGQAEPAGFGDGSGFSEPASMVASEDPRLVELITAGKDIQAIKLYRELTGTGLAEAKDAVDGLKRLHRPTG
jgi:ribosomal protein L7/L12